jgi:hypothetical protein
MILLSPYRLIGNFNYNNPFELEVLTFPIQANPNDGSTTEEFHQQHNALAEA